MRINPSEGMVKGWQQQNTALQLSSDYYFWKLITRTFQRQHSWFSRTIKVTETVFLVMISKSQWFLSHLQCLKLKHTQIFCQISYLLLLVTTKFEVFAALDRQLFPELALGAFHLQYNLLGRLGLHTEKSKQMRKPYIPLDTWFSETSLPRQLSVLVLAKLKEPTELHKIYSTAQN